MGETTKERCDSEVLEGFLRGGEVLVLKSSFKFIRQKRGSMDNPTRRSQGAKAQKSFRVFWARMGFHRASSRRVTGVGHGGQADGSQHRALGVRETMA